MDQIECSYCHRMINIDEALEEQIKARYAIEFEDRQKIEIEAIKKQAEELANRKLKEKLEAAENERRQEMELEREKIASDLKSSTQLETKKQELRMKQLEDESKADKEFGKSLLEQLGKLTEELRKEKAAHAQTELEAQKKLSEKEAGIREETRKAADEANQMKLEEMEKKLRDTKKALDDAQRKAAQGSQQNQGEVLELSLEDSLCGECPFDIITEVKKGQRGADVIQTINNNRGEMCGTLLWETKNASWQPSWIQKFKNDIHEANADAGILVSNEIPEKHGDLANIDGIWVVKPKLALAMANLMCSQIIGIHNANNNSKGKDAKMEIIYQYLTGPEFRNRVEAILDNYNILQKELEKERRSCELRWARQEKAMRAVIDSTSGMYGDLQGLTGGALNDIKQLESEDTEDKK